MSAGNADRIFVGLHDLAPSLSAFKNRNACGHVPSLSGIKVIDTTGAGDIFGGSTVWKLLQLQKAPEALNAEELTDVVRFACTAAGLSTTRSGGISSVPEYAQVLEAM